MGNIFSSSRVQFTKKEIEKKNNDYFPGFGKNSDFEWFIVWLKKEIEA